MDLSNSEIVHVKEGPIEYLQFRRLLQYKDILQHAYSLGIDRNFRTSVSNYADAMNDYKLLCDAINLDVKNIVKPLQIHSDIIKVVDKKSQLHELNSDGLITNKKNIILSTTNADCILLILFDPKQKVIANVHSGWKGTLQRISVKAVQKMCMQFQCKAEDIIICICPSIRKCHFEVEKDVKELFEKEFQDIEKNYFIVEKIVDKKWNIDTVEINKQILQKEGIKKNNIIDSGICSVCNSELIHSYRVEGKEYKLNTAIISM